MLRFNKNAPSNAHRNFSISIHLMLRFNPEVLRLVKHTDNYFNTSYVKVQHTDFSNYIWHKYNFNTSYVKVQPETLKNDDVCSEIFQYILC